MKKIINIIGWIVLLLAFASLGFATDNPRIGVPAYAVFFLIVFVLVYFLVKRQGDVLEEKPKNTVLINKILGIILLLVSLLSPIYSLRKIHLPFFPNLMIFIITLVLIILGALAISIINNSRGKNLFIVILGYLLLLIIASIPAFGASMFLTEYFPNIYNALGTAYWAAISVAIFAWWGFSLLHKK